MEIEVLRFVFSVSMSLLSSAIIEFAFVFKISLDNDWRAQRERHAVT